MKYLYLLIIGIISIPMLLWDGYCTFCAKLYQKYCEKYA